MENEQNLTPLMQQYLQIKEQYKSEIVFFRLGDFYEMFNEEAVFVSKLLNLTLTHRGPSPMCGIPYHASKIYIARLLRLGKKVVICEQVGDPKAKGLTERKVTEVITPGTAIEADYLEGNLNNFLAAMSVSKNGVGFAFIDVTTGMFKATSWHSNEMAEQFSKELGRANPRELLLPQSLRNNSLILDTISLYPNMAVSYYPDWDFNTELSYKRLTEQFKTSSLFSFGLNEKSSEVAPAGFLLDYLLKTTNSIAPHVSSIQVYKDENYLVIDDSSRRNLEIVSNLRDGTSQFSLLECVNNACTAMGSRMIRQWLLFPLTDSKKIYSRQEHISFFFENRNLMNQVRQILSNILDIERLASRIAMERCHAKDLIALKNSLIAWIKIKNELSEYELSHLDEQKALNVIELISNSILENPATSITEGGIIKEGWSEELDHWRSVHDNFDQILSEYEKEERKNTGISTLKIRYTNAFGYFIEVSKGKLSAVPQNFIMRRALVNGDRYTTERLQELEHELNESGTKILELERDLFVEIRTKLHEAVPYLMQVADEIAYTDCACSFAKAALVNGWTRPEITETEEFFVEEGRHPVVEAHIPNGEFVPNNLSLNESSAVSFALITGPNMAGKSTFLRQNALIALLAQTGSFVPAKKAKIGLVDRIFCRVGASDNLARGESTFLVEMTETANILRCATKKSLVIMDEVGRGTSTEDGLSIAWAVSEYLLNTIQCRSLFATHYHELTRIEHNKLTLLCMDVSEQGEKITFLRKVRQGASENSYGIHVASLAGVPKEVTDRANQILSHIQSVAENKPLLVSETPTLQNSAAEKVQKEEKVIFNSPGLFSDEEMILDEILSCDTDNMTPISALQAILRWKKTLSGQ